MCQLPAYLVWKLELIQQILHRAWIKLSDHFRVDICLLTQLSLKEHNKCSVQSHTYIYIKHMYLYIYILVYIVPHVHSSMNLPASPHTNSHTYMHMIDIQLPLCKMSLTSTCTNHHSPNIWSLFFSALITSSSYYLHVPYNADLHQYLWYPTPRTSGQQPDPVRLALLLCGHLLHGGLWRRHPPNLAFAAPGGHHDLCGAHCASHPGEEQQR